MKRVNLLIDEAMLDHFKDIPGTLSEKIRQAMYEYLKNRINVSASQSRKEGNNG